MRNRTAATYVDLKPQTACLLGGLRITSKTGLLTLNLTYDTTTMTLTKVTGSVGTL